MRLLQPNNVIHRQANWKGFGILLFDQLKPDCVDLKVNTVAATYLLMNHKERDWLCKTQPLIHRMFNRKCIKIILKLLICYIKRKVLETKFLSEPQKSLKMNSPQCLEWKWKVMHETLLYNTALCWSEWHRMKCRNPKETMTWSPAILFVQNCWGPAIFEAGFNCYVRENNKHCLLKNILIYTEDLSV